MWMYKENISMIPQKLNIPFKPGLKSFDYEENFTLWLVEIVHRNIALTEKLWPLTWTGSFPANCLSEPRSRRSTYVIVLGRVVMKKPLLVTNTQLTGWSKVIFIGVNLIDQFSGLVIGSEARVRFFRSDWSVQSVNLHAA